MKILRWQPPFQDSDEEDSPTSVYDFGNLWDNTQSPAIAEVEVYNISNLWDETLPLLPIIANNPPSPPPLPPYQPPEPASRKSQRIRLSRSRTNLDDSSDEEYTSQIWESDSSGGAPLLGPVEDGNVPGREKRVSWESDSDSGAPLLDLSERDKLPEPNNRRAFVPRPDLQVWESDDSLSGAPLLSPVERSLPKQNNRRASVPKRNSQVWESDDSLSGAPLLPVEHTKPEQTTHLIRQSGSSSGGAVLSLIGEYEVSRHTSQAYQSDSSGGAPVKDKRHAITLPLGALPIHSPSCSSEYSTQDPPIPSLPPAWLDFLDEEIASTEQAGGFMEFFTHSAMMVLRSYFTALDAHPCPNLKHKARSEDERWRDEMATWAADILNKINDDWLSDERGWRRFKDKDDLEGFWWLVWGAAVEVVVRMDYAGDEMDGVVRLVKALLGREKGRVVLVVGGNGRKWTGCDIPGFGDIWEEAHVSIEAIWFVQSTPEQWISAVSFLGRLTGAGLVEWWGLGVQELDDALSGENWRYADPFLECYVLAAAEYIKHAGMEFARACASGCYGLSLDFWDVWQVRFAGVTEYLEEGPAMWAALEAQRVMWEIRRSVDFTDLVAERMERVFKEQRRLERDSGGQ